MWDLYAEVQWQSPIIYSCDTGGTMNKIWFDNTQFVGGEARPERLLQLKRNGSHMGLLISGANVKVHLHISHINFDTTSFLNIYRCNQAGTKVVGGGHPIMD